MEDKEKRNKRIGLLTSAGVHGLLLLLFLFAMAWRAPDPPLPEFGVEINLGFDDEGSGDVQPEEPTANTQQQEEVPDQKVTEEQQQQPTEEVKPIADQVKEEVVTTNKDADVAVKTEKETVKEIKKPEEKKVVDENLKFKKDEPKVDKPTDKTGQQPISQGDDKNKTGDKGQPDGVLDPNAQYKGTPGGGGGGNGFGLSMAGWQWADQPKIPNLPDNEDGRIVFEIECDADGEIVGINTIERGLSPKAEQLLKEEIRRNSLMRTGGGQVPEKSKGRVVFILKTR